MCLKAQKITEYFGIVSKITEFILLIVALLLADDLLILAVGSLLIPAADLLLGPAQLPVPVAGSPLAPVVDWTRYLPAAVVVKNRLRCSWH